MHLLRIQWISVVAFSCHCIISTYFVLDKVWYFSCLYSNINTAWISILLSQFSWLVYYNEFSLSWNFSTIYDYNLSNKALEYLYLMMQLFYLQFYIFSHLIQKYRQHTTLNHNFVWYLILIEWILYGIWCFIALKSFCIWRSFTV